MSKEINTAEYSNILQQAVQEIRTARITIANKTIIAKRYKCWSYGS